MNRYRNTIKFLTEAGVEVMVVTPGRGVTAPGVDFSAACDQPPEFHGAKVGERARGKGAGWLAGRRRAFERCRGGRSVHPCRHLGHSRSAHGVITSAACRSCPPSPWACPGTPRCRSASVSARASTRRSSERGGAHAEGLLLAPLQVHACCCLWSLWQTLRPLQGSGRCSRAAAERDVCLMLSSACQLPPREPLRGLQAKFDVIQCFSLSAT